MGEEYKISLGVELNTDDLQTQINDAGKDVKPMPINIEIENLDEIKKQISSLGKNDKKNTLTLNTDSLEASLRDVKNIISDIKTSIGTIDSKSGMKSLLSSINQISSALDKASRQFENLNANLNALSGKDLSLNFGINLGGSNSVARQGVYGNKVRSETLPQLKQQVSDLVKYYNTTYKESLNEFEALQKIVSGTKLNNGDFFESFLFGKDSVASRMGNGSLSSQMQAYKSYIDMFKQAASLKGIDLSSVTSGFSKSADELIKDAQDVQTGTKEMEDSFEKLKQIFGGGNNLSIEGLSASLEPIINDLTAIRQAIEGLSNGISIEGLTQSFDRLSDTIEKLVQNATQVKSVLGNGLSNADISNQAKAAQETANAYQEVAKEAKKLDNISIDISNGNIDDLKNALKNLKVDDTSIENMVNKLNEMNIVAKNVSGTLKNGELVKWNVKGIQSMEDGLERVATLTTTIGKKGTTTSEQFSQSFDKMADAAQKIQSKLKDTGFDGFEAEMNRVKASAASLEGTYDELENALRRLDVAFESINAANEANDVKRLATANEEYEAALKQVYSQLKLNQQAERLKTAKANLSSDMDNWLKENTKAAKDFGAEIRRLQSSLDGLDANGVKRVGQQFNLIKKEAKAFGKTGLTVFDQLKNKIKEYSVYFGAAEMFMYAEQALRSMFEQVKLIDSAMTELKKVTNETDEAYNKFLTNAADRAKEIGTTIDGLVKSTADFARLGYGFEDAQGLAEVANIYAVVGDEIEGVEGATESLISTMAAFKNEMNGMSNTDFAMSIIDSFNELGNNFAISSGGLGEALERSASSLAAANNTLHESAAMITAANEVTQNPEKVGNAMKTISMRIRGKFVPIYNESYSLCCA